MKYKKKRNISRNILMFFFSKLVIFMKRRNKKIRFEVKKKKSASKTKIFLSKSTVFGRTGFESQPEQTMRPDSFIAL